MARRICLVFLILSLLVASGCNGSVDTIQGYSSRYTIGVLLKSMKHQHWMDVRSGAVDAAQDLGVEIIILYPSEESAIEEQKAIFSDMVKMNLDAILFAPCDSEDCTAYVEMAREKGIEVLNIDTRSNDVVLPYIGADNRKIGGLAAVQLAELTKGGGSIAIVSGVKEQASHQERMEGFRAELEKFPQLRIASVKYANSDFRLAMKSMEEIMRETPGISGIFCTSAVMGLGVIEQKKNNFYGNTPFIVAVDTQDDALSALKNGTLDGLVTQNGYEAGYRAVQVAVDQLNGVKIEQDTYIETVLLARGTVDEYLNKYSK